MLSLNSSNLPLLSCSSSSSSSLTRLLNPPQYSTLRLPAVSHHSRETRNTVVCNSRSSTLQTQKWVTKFLTVGAAMALVVGVGPTLAAESPSLPLLSSSIELHEPSNALSLPTWAIHVSSVAEWIIAMALVWQYGKKPGKESWKGLSWGMVPLLGGAMCACTWHFFYNAESLEVLVALQAALTIVGNATLCVAAFRIYKSQGCSENI